MTNNRNEVGSAVRLRLVETFRASMPTRRTPFEKPLVVWLEPGKPQAGVRNIVSVEDGLAALHRYGLERLNDRREPCPEWVEAARALSRARVHPTPDVIRSAYSALRHAAEKAGAAADADAFGMLTVRGLPFAP